MTTITVCTTCRRDKTDESPVRDGARLLSAVDGAVLDLGTGANVTVRGIACMSACDMSCAAQISGDDRFTYVLAGLDPDTTAGDLVTMALTHGETEHGLVVKSQRPAAIKQKVIARVPPAGFTGFPLVNDWRRPEDEEVA